MISQQVIEIGSIYLSDMVLTYDSKSYLDKVTPESFDTLKTSSDASTTFEFSVIDPPTVTYARTDFKDQTMVVRLLLDGAQAQAWKLKIYSCVYNVGVWECKAKGMRGEIYTGIIPKTKHPNALFPDDNIELEDLNNYRFPVVFGTAYVPLMAVCPPGNYGYLLGLNGPTYTVTELTTPHDYPGGKTAYAVGTTEFPHSQDAVTVAGVDYQIYKPLLDDTDDDGIGDELGHFSSAGSLYPPLVEFTNSTTSAFTGLEKAIELILEHCGVASADIDTGAGSTFVAAGAICTTRGIAVNGGFWEVESCQSAIESLLAHGDLYLYEAEKLELHAFSSTSTETFTLSDTVDESFSVSPRTVVINDGGIVKWVDPGDPADGKPQDKFNGMATVGCYDSQTSVDSPGETFIARFFSDSQLAQTAGKLKFAKQYLIEDDVSFESPYSKISTINTITPNKVIRINDSLFGDYYIIIETINFKQMSAVISGIRLKYLEDWDDITSDSVSILNYTPIGFIAGDGADGTDGVSPITGALSKPVFNVAADSDGTGYSLTGSGGTFEMFEGATDVTTSSAFAIPGGTDAGTYQYKNQNGLIFRLYEATGVYSLSGTWTSDSETFEITGTYGGVTVTRYYTITKAIAGEDANYVLVTGEQVFKFLADQTTPVSSTITLTAYLFGALTVYDWEYWNGSAWTNLSGTQNAQTYSLAYNNAAWSTATSLRVRCKSGTAYDEITIVKIYDGDSGATGDTGETGEPGIDAIRLDIKNPNCSIGFDGDDNALSGAYDDTGTIIRLYEGDTELVYDGVGTSASRWKSTAVGTAITPDSTPTDSGNYVTYSAHSGLTAAKGYITYTIEGKRADGSAINIVGVQNFTKVKYGNRSGSIFTFEESTSGISIANAALWVGVLTEAAAQDVATEVIANSEDGYIRPNDRITVTDNSLNLAGTRVFTGTATDTAGDVDENDFSSLVVETFHGSVIVDGTLSASKLATDTALINNLLVGSYITIGEDGAIFSTDKITYGDTTDGFWLGEDPTDSKYKFNIGGATEFLKWDGSNLTISGSLTIQNPSTVRTDINVADGADVTSTIINGGLITTGSIVLQDGASAEKAGITAAGTGDTNIRIWAGDTSANRATAPFRVTQGGSMVASDVTLTVPSGKAITIADGGDIIFQGVNSALIFDEGLIYSGTVTFNVFSDPSSSLHLWSDTEINIDSEDVLKLQAFGSDNTIILYETYTQATKTIRPASGVAGAIDLGTSAYGWGDVYLADNKAIKFGSDQDASILYDETTDHKLEITCSNGITISGATAFLSALSVAGNVIPTADGTLDLGSSAYAFQKMYVQEIANPNDTNGYTTALNDGDNNIRFKWDGSNLLVKIDSAAPITLA